MPISSAYDSKIQSDFAIAAAADATFTSAATTIATATAAGATSVILTSGNWTPALVAYLRERKYEVKLQAGSTTNYEVDWFAPRD